MAVFRLAQGHTFQANHFGHQGSGHDGYETNVAGRGGTYPYPDALQNDYWSGNIGAPGSVRLGYVETTVPISFPYNRYGDDNRGDSYSGSGYYDRTEAYSFEFYDYTQTGSGGATYIGSVSNVTVSYRLFEQYQRRGAPDSGNYSLEWNYTADSANLGWQIFAGDDDVTLGEGDDFFVDPAGKLNIDLGGGNDILHLYAPDPMDTQGDTVQAGSGNDSIQYQGNFGTFYLGEGDDEIGSFGAGAFGQNRFWGGSGSDTIRADANSTIFEEVGSENDRYFGDSQTTTLSFEYASVGVRVDLGQGFVFGGATYGTDALSGIVNVIGSEGGDNLTGLVVNFGNGFMVGSRLYGRGGNDLLRGAEYIDLLDGGNGRDQLFGEAGSDTLNGGGDDDLLDGGTEADTLVGGLGNDTYVVDVIGDVVTEAAGAGTDTIRTALATYSIAALANIENLTGTAASGQTLTGNAGTNTITGAGGSDTINGGTGTDTMDGGSGNDTYFVDNPFDVIVEAAGQGANDRVAASVSYTLRTGVEVEQLLTTYSGGTGAINLTGNEFAQTITGNAGANTLDGRGGADTLSGLAGNDTYFVDNAADVIVEAAGQGTNDRVATSVSYTLRAGVAVEQLLTTYSAGTGALYLTGNEFAQAIAGNAGANRFYGAGGNDTLTGGGGDDRFYFTTAPNASTNRDTITDFSNASGNNDSIYLSRTVFAALTGASGAVLSASQFATNTTGVGSGDRHIIYNTATGALFYDANTGDTAAGVQFAQLGTTASHPSGITSADFFLV